jgi:formylglycine-generating enzyme required for sulfatase activity
MYAQTYVSPRKENVAIASNLQSAEVHPWNKLSFLLRLLVFCVVTAFLSMVFSSEASAQNKRALLVAVDEYSRSDYLNKLNYAQRDAEAIRDILEKKDGSGYNVTLLLGPQATQDRILKELDTIAKAGVPGGHLILGFFGHGVQYGSDAYFCPYDAALRQVVNADGQKQYDGNRPLLEPDPQSLVHMREMLGSMAVSKVNSRLLLADCCRENPNSARGLAPRAFGSGTKLSDLPDNSAAFFACDENEKAQELEDMQHGAFTRAFLDAFAKSERPTANGLSAEVPRGVTELLKSYKEKQNVKTVVKGVVDLGIVNIRLNPSAAMSESSASRNAPKLVEPPSVVNTVRNTIDMQMVPIRGGQFQMGSPEGEEGRYKDEKLRQVAISSFYMSVTEVTQSQYQAVMGSNPSVVKGPHHPVESVKWEDVVKFCQALSNRPEEKAAGRSYRLPTEAEWEYAARAGQAGAYHFGDRAMLDEFAWNKNNTDKPHEVRTKKANSFGLHDMYGNVYEWCSDWYTADLERVARQDPKGPATGTERVMRGGSFRDDAKLLRSAARLSFNPQESKAFCGFRVVMEIPAVSSIGITND